MTNIENLAMERIEQLVEMAAHHTSKGNEELSDLLLLEASDLALIMDGESRLFLHEVPPLRIRFIRSGF
jgi:hypothetical protein